MLNRVESSLKERDAAELVVAGLSKRLGNAYPQHFSRRTGAKAARDAINAKCLMSVLYPFASFPL